MDGQVDQRPAELRGPPRPPRDRVVGRPSPPRGLHGRQVGAPRDALLDEELELLDPVAEAVLEDRHHATAGALLGVSHPVHVVKGPGQRLLADHVPPRVQGLERLRHVQVGRRADVDDVELVHVAERAEVRQDARDRVRRRDLARFLRVEVADRRDLEPVGQAPVCLDVQPSDPTADDSHLQRVGHSAPLDHGTGSSLTALAWASSASRQARKQCACDMAVSVRSRMSETSCRP